MRLKKWGDFRCHFFPRWERSSNFYSKYSDSIIFLTRMCCHVCCPLKSLLLGCHAAGAAAALHGSTVDIFDPEKWIPNQDPSLGEKGMTAPLKPYLPLEYVPWLLQRNFQKWWKPESNTSFRWWLTLSQRKCSKLSGYLGENKSGWGCLLAQLPTYRLAISDIPGPSNVPIGGGSMGGGPCKKWGRPGVSLETWKPGLTMEESCKRWSHVCMFACCSWIVFDRFLGRPQPPLKKLVPLCAWILQV